MNGISITAKKVCGVHALASLVAGDINVTNDLGRISLQNSHGSSRLIAA